MSKQTAVDCYEKEINYLLEKYEAKEISKREFITMKHNLFYGIKEMEKEQIVEAINYGCSDWGSFKDGREYYKETFKKI